MKMTVLAALALAALAPCAAAMKAVRSSFGASPVQKVVQLLSDLETKVIAEGEAAHKTYLEYSEWCEDKSKNLQYEVKTAKAEVANLVAAIDHAGSEAAAHSAAIEDTSASMATNEADLKAATAIRKTEEADFAASEKELSEVISALERAVAILEREARQGSAGAGAAMVQLGKAGSVTEAIRLMVESSMLGSQGAARLTALVQSAQGADDESDAFGAPDPTVYESHSSSIVETLEDILEKAKDQLADARKKETTSTHNFGMLKQSLEDEIKFAGEAMEEAKKGLSAQTGAKAGAEGDLAETKKSLAEDEKVMGSLKQNCMLKAQDFESATKSRGEELKALAEAKKAIADMTGGAGDISYSFRQGPAFLQERSQQSGLRTAADLANFEAVRFVRNLARQQHSEALAQLARRMASAARYGAASGDDPFAKVKGLIRDMIETLAKDAQADASHKAYCDKELGETMEKRADKEAEDTKLSTKIDAMSASSAQLKEQVASLQAALAELASSQAELSKLRQDEKNQYQKNKPEMEKGLEGVKLALKILHTYYAKEDKAHEAAEGSSSSIIGLLEVVESDFSKTLAELSAAEATSEADYEAETKENAVEKATKDQDVKYKTKEYKQLDATVAELSSDREGVRTELSAILEYKTHLQQMCMAKPETYAERKGRREAEIAGLKEALEILAGEGAFLQRRAALTRRHVRRGSSLRGGGN